MKKPQPSSEDEGSSAEDVIDDQLSQEKNETEFTTPLKSNSSSQEAPLFPLNSKYEPKPPTSDSAKKDYKTGPHRTLTSNANFNESNYSPADDTEPTQPLASTDADEEINEPVTKTNVKNLYKELCELEHLFIENLGLEWFYFIFEGEDLHEIKRVFTNIDSKLEKERNFVLPERCNVWKWAQDVGSPNDVKVVIVGQDPSVLYTTNDDWTKIPMSCGTAFEVSPEFWEKMKTLGEGTSLKYIMKTAAPLTADSDSFDGNLRPWTEQGVLLINAILTTTARREEEKIEGGQHWDFNWEFVTRMVLKKLGSESREPTVMMPWGVKANKLLKEAHIDPKHKVIQACHPVWQTYCVEDLPSNCYCYEFCWMQHREGEAEPRNDFKTANEFLEHHGRKGIVWDCFGKKVLLRRKSTQFRDNLERCDGDTKTESMYRNKTARELFTEHTEEENANKEDKENVDEENSKSFKRGLDKNNEDDVTFSNPLKKLKPSE